MASRFRTPPPRSYRFPSPFPFPDPVADYAGGSEVAEVDVTERIDNIVNRVIFGVIRVNRHQRETGPGARVLAGQRFGSGHPEFFGAFDPALYLDEHEVIIGGAGADVVTGVAVRHLLRNPAE